MSKHAVVVEDGQRTKRMGRRLKVGAGIFGGMMAIGTGVAVAAWLVTGSGTGSGSASVAVGFGRVPRSYYIINKELIRIRIVHIRLLDNLN
jgi:hypothetical protein